MSEIIDRVNSIKKIDYRGETVITFAMMDELHNRPDGTAGRNFRQHKGKMLLGRHYFEVMPSDSGSTNFVGPENGGNRKEVILLTERGYLLLVKSFRDDLAWSVQDVLVEHYFRSIEQLPSSHLLSIEDARKLFFDGTVMAIKPIADSVERLEKNVEDGFLLVNRRIDNLEHRKSLTANTKRQHIDTVQSFFNGKCPCCQDVYVLDEFSNKNKNGNWEHWYSPSRSRPHETWLVCEGCNDKFFNNHQFKIESETHFRHYQKRREQRNYPLLGGVL